MDTTTLIDSLVETYKKLNVTFRSGTPNDRMISIVTRMRDDEIQFSQALKDRITGIGTYSGDKGAYVEGAGSTFAQLISQFGSARATTLNLLKGIQGSDVWTKPLEDGSTIRSRVQELAESDRTQLARLAEAAS
ncbi:MAG: hypothetical protein M9909_13055 [Thermomicrobiales bacterium]|nr:hypothetical protein [Thermomicrobiales bacterium]